MEVPARNDREKLSGKCNIKKQKDKDDVATTMPLVYIGIGIG